MFGVWIMLVPVMRVGFVLCVSDYQHGLCHFVHHRYYYFQLLLLLTNPMICTYSKYYCYDCHDYNAEYCDVLGSCSH